ncbi:cysteine-rich KTR domain-containing protein [Cloacibacillus porcorum]|uniref:cysteine-rich KTR domain-containing protein n=1 Tax=Cloacibacillus porcorum TaxID=1197717 RepID=UPI000A040649|nr:cysteine-rich KTR domain-containing protein [Cloacibacillus porcorum]
MNSFKLVLCPVCGSKTRIKADDTILKNYPLFSPKCRCEALINVKQLNTSIITEPDAKTQSR